MRTMKQLEEANAEIKEMIGKQNQIMTNYNTAYQKASDLKNSFCVIADGINEERNLLKLAEKEAAEKKEIKE